MIIESIQLNGFGCLSGEYAFSEGMNLIVAGNETGKTTLADALMCILYGLKPGVRRGGCGNRITRRYAPLGSDSFAASAVVCTAQGRRLNIWRDFSLGTLRVLELASGRDITLEFDLPPNGDSFGEMLTGLTAGQYRKLAFLAQDELNNDWDFVEFVDSLSALFSTDDSEGVSLEEARANLEDSIAQYEGITGKGRLKVETEIKRLQERIVKIDLEISEIEQVFSEVEKRFEEAADKRLATDNIRNSIKKYDYLSCLLQREELEKKLDVMNRAREQIESISAEIEDLAGVRNYQYADIENIAELQALYSDKIERAGDIHSLKETRRKELEYLRVRVENLGKRSNITQDYLLRIEQAIAVLESNLGRERSVRLDCRNAEKMLVQAGIDPDEIRRFNDWKENSRDVEVEFVRNYTQIREQIENKEFSLKNYRQEHVAVLKDIASARMYRYRFSRNNLILGCVFTGLSVFFYVAMGFLLFMLLPAVACLCWAVFGALRLIGTQVLGKEEEQAAQEEIARYDEILSGFPEKYAKMDEKFTDFAEHMTLSRSGLLELVQKVHKAEKEVNNWEQRVDRHKAIEAVIDDSYATLQSIFCEIGIADEQTKIDITRARVFMREVSDALSLIEQYESLKQSQDELSEQESELLGDISELKTELDDVFAQAGIEVLSSDFTSAMSEFKDRIRSLRRLEQLEEVVLPAALDNAGSLTEIETIMDEISIWDERVEKMIIEEPWLAAHTPAMSILDYGNEIKLARLKLEDTEGELAEREKALAVETGRRREKLPLLQDERACACIALKKAENFSKAVSLALKVFEDISSELHSRWSPLFSEEFNSYIEQFSDKLRFSLSKELKICAVQRDSGIPVDREEINSYLSKGMRDQVYLSLRLLLAQKVTRGTMLPVILDDPFVNADERRFIQAMEQLLEFSRNGQVFVFSCHELRHERLCSENELFRSTLLKL